VDAAGAANVADGEDTGDVAGSVIVILPVSIAVVLCSDVCTWAMRTFGGLAVLERCMALLVSG
jgi:hypothetical protein